MIERVLVGAAFVAAVASFFVALFTLEAWLARDLTRHPVARPVLLAWAGFCAAETLLALLWLIGAIILGPNA